MEKKLPPPAPRKPTLLELAMMNKQVAGDAPAPSVAVLLKQKKLAHQIVAKSQVKLYGSNDEMISARPVLIYSIFVLRKQPKHKVNLDSLWNY